MVTQISNRYRMHCDFCGECETEEYPNFWEMIDHEVYRNDGWSRNVITGICQCPACRAEENESIFGLDQ